MYKIKDVNNYSLQRNLLRVLTLIFLTVGQEYIPIDRNITLDEINALTRHENNSKYLKDSILSNFDRFSTKPDYVEITKLLLCHSVKLMTSYGNP